MKNILLQHKITAWLLALILCAVHLNAQQLPDPTQNAPTGLTNTITTQTPYPGLINLTNTGKFNYVRTIVPDVPVQVLPASGIYDRITTDYFDGLGRPLQTVAQKAHAEGNDIVVPHVYDALGRETYQYLPFAAPLGLLSNQGKIKMDVNTKLRGFYDQNGFDEQPYSKTELESSALGRVTKQMAPGKSWVGNAKGVESDYYTNSTWPFQTALNYYLLSGGYPRWTISSAASALPVYQGDYAPGQLYITSITDEDGKKALEVKDKQGRVVMKMAGLTTSYLGQMRPSDYAYTHYVYDDMGNLRCVIPPAVRPTPSGAQGSITWPTITQQIYDGLCYGYFYDERNRMVEKKVPGKEVEWFVYDKRDRLIMYQDGTLRNGGFTPNPSIRWKFTYYDALDRPTMTTVCLAEENRQQMAALIEAQGNYAAPHWLYYFNHYDLMHVYPSGIDDPSVSGIITANYYDDYAQLSGFSFDASQFDNLNLPTDGTVVPSVYSSMTRGLLTGTRFAIRDPEYSGLPGFQYSVNYYDANGRLIQTQKQNLRAGLDITSYVYYFQGMLYKTIERHQNPGARPIPNATDGAITQYRVENTFKRNLGIDGGNDQVWKHTQKINGGIDYELGYYGYDHLGRIVTKQFPVGVLTQQYNMRGFLNQIDFKNIDANPVTTLFQEKLFYDIGFGNKFYNGNIAGITWMGVDNVQKSYGYSYDGINRLNHAEFRLLSGTWGKTKDFTASAITYDFNGNILTMNQMVTPQGGSNTMMDQLAYTYAPNSNQLIKVKDLGTVNNTLPDFKDGADLSEEYTYDYNGNLKTDANKKISEIRYFFDKPEAIFVTDPAHPGILSYVYDGFGNKLRKNVRAGQSGPITEVWSYIGNFVYKNDTLQYILNEEGRARPVASDPNNTTSRPTKFVYDYFVKDHLGNVRSTVTANPMNYAYYARHEIATANIEQLVFDNIPNVRDLKPGSTDPNDGMAAGLDASDPATRIGTAILLKTLPGDRFRISADAFYDGEYENSGTVGSDQIVQSLVSALTGGATYAGVPLSELPDNVKTVNTLLGNPNVANMVQQLSDANNNPDAPKAHLNYLWFDERMQLVPGYSGSIQVQANSNGTGSWVTLSPSGSGGQNASDRTVGGGGTPGYLLVYIDNQSIGKKVWFDNVSINEYTSEVTEEDHYYPYGLTLNLIPPNNIPNGVKQPYKLTTKELESNFGINAYDFGARMQDMQLGRWWSMDPLAEKYDHMSPYTFCGNNPAKFADIDGKDYGVYISNTITLKEIIYTAAASSNSAQQNANRINSQSGRYEWVVGSGSNEKAFPVNFEISIVPTVNDAEANRSKAMDKSGDANVYGVVNDETFSRIHGANTNGNTIGDDITIRSSHEDSETGAHEMGHAMGMVHNKKGHGLMNDDRKLRTNTDLQERDISDAIIYPLKGETNYEYQDNQKIKAGKGHIVNDSGLSNKEIMKGKLRQIDPQ